MVENGTFDLICDVAGNPEFSAISPKYNSVRSMEGFLILKIGPVVPKFTGVTPLPPSSYDGKYPTVALQDGV